MKVELTRRLHFPSMLNLGLLNLLLNDQVVQNRFLGALGVTSAGGSNYWNKKPIDLSLGISDLLMAKFSLNPDGTKKA